MSFWDKLVEDRIREASEQGAFDDLPGAGKPVRLEDDSRIEPELRLAYKILSNAGYVPEEIELKKQIDSIHELMRDMPDEKSRYQAMQRLNYLKAKLDTMRPGTLKLEDARYTAKLIEKLSK